jgi:prepilin-type processing-associated H-X9-DG protein
VDPYIQGSFLFGCPASRDLRWGYAMNRFLSSVPMPVIAEPAQTPLLFDSALGIPNALAHPDFAAARHPEGANVVYIDGRVGVAHSEP